MEDNNNKDNSNITKAELEIEFIKKIIQESREKTVDVSMLGFIWGVIVILGLMNTYFMALFGIGINVGYFWLAIIISGWIITILDAKINVRHKNVDTFAVRIQNSVWAACGISMTIIYIVAAFQFETPKSDLVPYSYIINSMAINPIIAMILGIAYFVTGKINDDKIVVLFSYLWWIGSISMFYMKSYHTFLIFAIMMLFLQVIPMIINYRKYKK